MRLVKTLILLTLSITPALSWSLWPRNYEREHEVAVEKWEHDVSQARRDYTHLECRGSSQADPRLKKNFCQLKPSQQSNVLGAYKNCKELEDIIYSPMPVLEERKKTKLEKVVRKKAKEKVEYIDDWADEWLNHEEL